MDKSVRHRLFRHHTFRFALLFALFFTVVALGQYLFARQKAYREARHELLADATRLAESIGADWSKMGEYRRADFSIAQWYVFAKSGQLIDVAGFIPGIPSHVLLPIDPSSNDPETVSNEAGETFRVCSSRLRDLVVIVGAQVREGGDSSDSRLRTQSDLFIHAIAASNEPDYVKAARKLDFDIDYAVVAKEGALLAAGGGIPLKSKLEVAGFQTPGPRRILSNTYFLETAVVPSANGSPRGFVIVPRQFDTTSGALRDHAYFNLVIAVASWLVVVAVLAGAVRRRQTYSVVDAIKKGEGEEIEFKGSLKLDQRNGKSEDYLRTIVAFLNSGGGSLLIGVEDTGTVSGVAQDLERFSGSRDQMARHLANRIGSAFGTDVMTCIRIGFEEIDRLTVCRLDVDQSPEPVFWQGKEKGQVSLIVRAGSSSKSLDGREMSRYIRTWWK